MDAIYLGIDMGTTSAKCLAVDGRGEVLAMAQQPYPLQHPRQGWAEQDPEAYWQALVEIVGACMRQCVAHGHAAASIAALAMSTQGDTLIVTDAQGTALTPAMSWMDNRADAECQALLAHADQAWWYRETGLRLSPFSSACKIRWLAAHQPDLRARVRRIGAVPDYLTARLCGQFVTDAPSASWSPYYNPRTRAWSAPVLELLGVDAVLLPRVVNAGTTIGPLLPEVAAQLGLTSDTLLVAGAFDQAAAALGTGATVGGRSVLSCGTAWVLYTVASAPSSDAQAMLPLCCHTHPAEWGLLLPFTGGAAYDWCRRTFRCEDDAVSSDAVDPLFFLPYLYGAGAPEWQTDARGTLLGLTMAHTGADVAYAVQRGIACETRRNVELIEAQCGPIPTLRMVGGASHSTLWPQILADLLNRPLEVSTFAEGAGYGAAMLAAGPACAHTWPAREVSLVSPTRDGVRAMDDYYARYQHYRTSALAIYDVR